MGLKHSEINEAFNEKLVLPSNMPDKYLDQAQSKKDLCHSTYHYRKWERIKI